MSCSVPVYDSPLPNGTAGDIGEGMERQVVIAVHTHHDNQSTFSTCTCACIEDKPRQSGTTCMHDILYMYKIVLIHTLYMYCMCCLHVHVHCVHQHYLVYTSALSSSQ